MKTKSIISKKKHKGGLNGFDLDVYKRHSIFYRPVVFFVEIADWYAWLKWSV